MTVYVRTQRKERRRNEETRMEEGGGMYSGAVVIFCLFRIPRDAFVHPAGPKGLVFYRNGHNRKATQPGKLNFFENKPLLALANFF